MKFYGVKIAEGANVANLVVETGGVFPFGPDNPPDKGEMFYKTGSGEGLYVYDGTTWEAIGALSLDPELEALGSVTSAADTVPYFTGSGSAAVASFTSFGRQLVDDTGQTEARATLGLGTAATADLGTFGGVVPLLNGANTWSANQTFSGSINYGGITQASVQPATVTGRFARWNNANSRYEQFDLLGTANVWSIDQNYRVGTQSTQAINQTFGWTAGNLRWATVMESSADFAIYSYDSDGLNPIRRIGLQNAVGGNELYVGSATLSYGGNVVYHAGNFNPALKADLNSPALTGTPTAPTAAPSTNTTQLATTAFVQNAVASVSGGGGGITWNIVSTNTSIVAKNAYLVDCSGGTRDMTLPATVAVGDWFIVAAYGGSARIVNNGIVIQNIGAGNNLLVGADESAYLVANSSTTVRVV